MDSYFRSDTCQNMRRLVYFLLQCLRGSLLDFYFTLDTHHNKQTRILDVYEITFGFLLPVRHQHINRLVYFLFECLQGSLLDSYFRLDTTSTYRDRYIFFLNVRDDRLWILTSNEIHSTTLEAGILLLEYIQNQCWIPMRIYQNKRGCNLVGWAGSGPLVTMLLTCTLKVPVTILGSVIPSWVSCGFHRCPRKSRYSNNCLTN